MGDLFKGNQLRITKMAQWLWELVIKPNGLNSIPRTHMAEGENGLPQVVL